MKSKHARRIGLGLAVAPSGYGFIEPSGLHDPGEGTIEVQAFLPNSPRTIGLGRDSTTS